MEKPERPDEAIDELTQKIREQELQIQRETVEKAMFIVAPAVATLCFEGYKHRLTADREGAHIMIVMHQAADEPWIPIVYLPAPDVALLDGKATISFTPIAGEAGWKRFIQIRARANMND